ncbi:MAG: PUA domain-containing protein [Haloferacaceae archaeon]
MARDVAALRVVADYQFGAGAGAALFPPDEDRTMSRSTGGRPRQVHAGGRRLISFGTDGRFTLGVAGGERLRDALDPPAYRVVVGAESEPHVRDGANAFAKFVREADPRIRPRDEVLVVNGRDELLGVGTTTLAGDAMLDFGTGMAVDVREGAPADDD